MALHSYLGNGMEVVQSRNFLSEGDECELLIIPMRDLVLFPGDTVPMRLRDECCVRAIMSLMRGADTSFLGGLVSIHLGIVNLVDERINLGTIGTTSEIRGHRSQFASSSSRLLGDADEDEEMALIAKGCHRFRFLEEPRLLNGVLIARVQILSETYQNFSHQTLSKSPFQSWVYEKNSVPVLLEIANKLYEESLLFSDSAATATPEEWENNEECSDSSSALDVSPNCCRGKPGSINTRCCPSNEIYSTDPSLATYYLASNMTINDAQKQQLLDAENIVIRLRLIIAMLTKHKGSQIGCSCCGQILFRKNELFTVSGAAGVVGSYVNSGGYVHNTFTFRTLKKDSNVIVHGTHASAEDSWFPRYAWRIASCGECASHLGWLFTSDKPTETVTQIGRKGGREGGGERERERGGEREGAGREGVTVNSEYVESANSTDLGSVSSRPRGITSRSANKIFSASEVVAGLTVEHFWGVRRAAIEEIGGEGDHSSHREEEGEGEMGGGYRN